MSEHVIERCASCVLPTDYPGLEINSDGVCHCCTEDQKSKYLGLRALKRDVAELLNRFPDREYDCVLGLSGGRDSTYLLHILKEELGLNVLAFFVDHGLIPEHTRENVKKITKKMGVTLVVDSHTSLTSVCPKKRLMSDSEDVNSLDFNTSWLAFYCNGTVESEKSYTSTSISIFNNEKLLPF